MRSFLLAILAFVLIAAAASVLLDREFQKSADQAFTTGGARITSVN